MHGRIALSLAAAGLTGLLLTGCGAATPSPSAPGETAVVRMDGVTPVAPVKTPAKDAGGAKEDVPDTKLAREVALKEAAKFGILGALGGDDAGGVFGGILGAGGDDKGFGAGGLGLSGIGTGGGGAGQGIGLGSIGTIGHGGGGGGYAIASLGSIGATSLPSGTSISASATAVLELGDASTLGLNLDQAARALRGRMAALRGCYEDGLRKDKQMQGRVALRLVVGTDGSVAYVSLIRSDLASKEVTACLVKAPKGAYVGAPLSGFYGVIEAEMSFKPAPKR